MLIYEKWLEENDEKVRHLFGTEANIPAADDEQLAYQDAYGSPITNLTLNDTYLDDGKGGIIQKSTGMKIAVGIVDPTTQEVKIVVPESGSYDTGMFISNGPYYSYMNIWEDAWEGYILVSGATGEVSCVAAEELEGLTITADTDEQYNVPAFSISYSGDALSDNGITLNISDEKETKSITLKEFPNLEESNLYSVSDGSKFVFGSDATFASLTSSFTITPNKELFDSYVTDGEGVTVTQTENSYTVTGSPSASFGLLPVSIPVPGVEERFDEAPVFVFTDSPANNFTVNGEVMTDGGEYRGNGGNMPVQFGDFNPSIVKNSGDDTVSVSELASETYYGIQTLPTCEIQFASGSSSETSAEFTAVCGGVTTTFTVIRGGLG